MFEYIFLNTIIYGIIALALSAFYSYWKYLNFSIWIIVILLSYFLNIFFEKWFWIEAFLILFFTFFIYIFFNIFIQNKFPNILKRDLFWLISTLWLTLFIENLIGFIYSSSSISLPNIHFPFYFLLIIFLFLNFSIFYLHKISFFWKIFTGIFENENVKKTLWINIKKFTSVYFSIIFLLLIFVAYLSLTTWSIKPSDWVFFLLKWVWIMILVWIWKMEFIFIWALIYVSIEYFLFIKLWLPIAYKEWFILLIILLTLLIKPSWIFTLKTRKT